MYFEPLLSMGAIQYFFYQIKSWHNGKKGYILLCGCSPLKWQIIWHAFLEPQENTMNTKIFAFQILSALYEKGWQEDLC